MWNNEPIGVTLSSCLTLRHSISFMEYAALFSFFAILCFIQPGATPSTYVKSIQVFSGGNRNFSLLTVSWQCARSWPSTLPVGPTVECLLLLGTGRNHKLLGDFGYFAQKLHKNIL